MDINEDHQQDAGSNDVISSDNVESDEYIIDTMNINEDHQHDAASNDRISSDNFELGPEFLSIVKQTAKDEHVIVAIKACFRKNNIKYCYFQNHKRKDFVMLLKQYKIKYAVSMKLWTAFTNNNRASKHILLICGYSRQYFHGQYEDIIKLFIFYYASIDILPLIKSSLNKINWSNLALIKSQSMNDDSINKSAVIPKKAMNEFCFIALERLNNNYNNNLIQIGDKEWVLIVQIIDDDGNCDIGVSFKYNDKSEHLFVATAIYLDKTAIELKHRLIALKHCENISSFSLRSIKFINHDEMIDNDDTDNDDNVNAVITSSLA